MAASNSVSSMILVDIGKETINLVEVKNNNGEISVMKVITRSDIKRVVTTHGIEHVRGLVGIVVDTCKLADMKSTKLMITSSALGLRSALKRSDAEGVVPYTDETITTIVRSQTYGEVIGNDNIVTKYVVETIGDKMLLKAFCDGLAEAGYTVLSIEDRMTTTLNLLRLIPSSYDYPGKIIVDFGQTTNIFGCYKDVPLFSEDFNIKLGELINMIHEATDIEIDDINRVFYEVGIIDTPESRAILEHENIDADSYFSNVPVFCKTYIMHLRNQIDEEIYQFRLGRCYLIVTGGFADVPGLYSLISELFIDPTLIICKNSIARTYEGDFIEISNNLSNGKSDIGCIYGNCMGMLFRMFYKDAVNLVPFKMLNKYPDKSVILAAQVFMNVSAILFILGFSFLGYKVFNYFSINSVGSTSAISSELASAQSEKDDINATLEIINSIDQTGANLLKLIEDYNSNDLRVISIDSIDMIDGTSSSSTGSDVVIIDDSTTTDDTEDATITSAGKQDYIIRGYAESAYSISNFYSYLCTKCGDQTSIIINGDGIEKIELESGESMSVFQFTISGGVD